MLIIVMGIINTKSETYRISDILSMG